MLSVFELMWIMLLYISLFEVGVQMVEYSLYIIDVRRNDQNATTHEHDHSGG